MTILCIESSTSVCSAAISVDGKPYKQCICREGSNHARLLPRYIEELLRYAAEQHLSIDAVALSEGPGSYTGLRIGASTAKGLCYGLNVPLIPVPTLQVLVKNYESKITNYELRIADYGAGEADAVLFPMIDARRMEVYTEVQEGNGQWTRDNGQMNVYAVVVENEASLLDVQRDNVQCTKEYYYFGDGAAKCQAVLTKPNWHFVPDIVPEAQYMGEIVESQKSKVESIKMISGAELAYYEPFYLKEFVAAQSHVKGLKP